MTKTARFALLLPLLALAACQTVPYQPYAREVKKRPGNGGQIALKLEHRDEDREKAQSMMNANCGASAVNVVEEGEVAVGTTTTSTAQESNHAGSSGQQVGTLFGMPITSGASKAHKDTEGSATTVAVKEWTITYECAKAAADATEATPTKKKTKKQ